MRRPGRKSYTSCLKIISMPASRTLSTPSRRFQKILPQKQNRSFECTISLVIRCYPRKVNLSRWLGMIAQWHLLTSPWVRLSTLDRCRRLPQTKSCKRPPICLPESNRKCSLAWLSWDLQVKSSFATVIKAAICRQCKILNSGKKLYLCTKLSKRTISSLLLRWKITRRIWIHRESPTDLLRGWKGTLPNSKTPPNLSRIIVHRPTKVLVYPSWGLARAHANEAYHRTKLFSLRRAKAFLVPVWPLTTQTNTSATPLNM